MCLYTLKENEIYRLIKMSFYQIQLILDKILKIHLTTYFFNKSVKISSSFYWRKMVFAFCSIACHLILSYFVITSSSSLFRRLWLLFFSYVIHLWKRVCQTDVHLHYREMKKKRKTNNFKENDILVFFSRASPYLTASRICLSKQN